jgi:hypothetical protein
MKPLVFVNKLSEKIFSTLYTITILLKLLNIFIKIWWWLTFYQCCEKGKKRWY